MHAEIVIAALRESFDNLDAIRRDDIYTVVCSRMTVAARAFEQFPHIDLSIYSERKQKEVIKWLRDTGIDVLPLSALYPGRYLIDMSFLQRDAHGETGYHTHGLGYDS